MGASFRNIGEVIELAGCDLLTISPSLLTELQNTQGCLVAKLSVDKLEKKPQAEIQPVSEAQFLWLHHQDAMATEKLEEGIRNFAIDQNTLEDMVGAFIAQETIAQPRRLILI